jgi:hypothetical protein
MVPYNGSLFTLRQDYKTIFHQFAVEEAHNHKANQVSDSHNHTDKKTEDDCKETNDQILYKITYTVNLLTGIGPQGATDSLSEMF